MPENGLTGSEPGPRGSRERRRRPGPATATRSLTPSAARSPTTSPAAASQTTHDLADSRFLTITLCKMSKRAGILPKRYASSLSNRRNWDRAVAGADAGRDLGSRRTCAGYPQRSNVEIAASDCQILFLSFFFPRLEPHSGSDTHAGSFSRMYFFVKLTKIDGQIVGRSQ